MIRIVEVGPRDGLQNEEGFVPTEVKIAFINALSETGVDEIEVSSFVSPKWVPQLADAAEVFAGITRKPGMIYSALVPNEQGLDRALEARVDKIAVFTAASETFSRKNTNASIEESVARFVPVIRRAREAQLPVRGYISTAFWCPFEGRMSPEATVAVAKQLLDLGVGELSIGDTIGKAKPDEVRALLELLVEIAPTTEVVMHFHDTYDQAVENVIVSLEMGIRAFDSSVGGLGGCPYAPGAPGNVATEKLMRALRANDFGVNLESKALAEALDLVAPYLDRKP